MPVYYELKVGFCSFGSTSAVAPQLSTLECLRNSKLDTSMWTTNAAHVKVECNTGRLRVHGYTCSAQSYDHEAQGRARLHMEPGAVVRIDQFRTQDTGKLPAPATTNLSMDVPARTLTSSVTKARPQSEPYPQGEATRAADGATMSHVASEPDNPVHSDRQTFGAWNHKTLPRPQTRPKTPAARLLGGSWHEFTLCLPFHPFHPRCPLGLSTRRAERSSTRCSTMEDDGRHAGGVASCAHLAVGSLAPTRPPVPSGWRHKIVAYRDGHETATDTSSCGRNTTPDEDDTTFQSSSNTYDRRARSLDSVLKLPGLPRQSSAHYKFVKVLAWHCLRELQHYTRVSTHRDYNDTLLKEDSKTSHTEHTQENVCRFWRHTSERSRLYDIYVLLPAFSFLRADREERGTPWTMFSAQIEGGRLRQAAPISSGVSRLVPHGTSDAAAFPTSGY
ncbi:hypothetical protein C8Q70DRAFT_935314 [Cubamyces menziesii]|nr:hypothetical protein C8Q70DRAFT_935314 [Cubamyces menziesii]